MAKIRIPLEAVELNGTLAKWYYDNAVLRSDVDKSTDDTFAYATLNKELSINEVSSILQAGNGGEVSEYLMAVRAPLALLDSPVPDGLPKRDILDGSGVTNVKKFKEWLNPDAEIWKKDDNSEFIFYTNPFALNSINYLTGSEIKSIFNISAQVTVITVTDAKNITNNGWTKL